MRIRSILFIIFLICTQPCCTKNSRNEIRIDNSPIDISELGKINLPYFFDIRETINVEEEDNYYPVDIDEDEVSELIHVGNKKELTRNYNFIELESFSP